MQPLMAGNVLAASSKAVRSDVALVMSQEGALTHTPLDCISSTKEVAPSVFIPCRERIRRFLAPLVLIHLATLLPWPPNPPAMTYVACAVKISFCTGGTIA